MPLGPHAFDPHNVTGHYVLDGKTPVEERDLYMWAAWFERSGPDRCVGWTELPNGLGHISTVFLGIDCCLGMRPGAPVLFETMSFIGDEHEDYFDRYCTWEEAEAGHAEIVARAVAATGVAIEHAAAGLAAALVPGGGQSGE